jgi:phenylpyruvate tautomerase PptA (4-oxalocrotonate tautomerase family)
MFLLRNGFGSRAFADNLTSTGTIAGGFVVNGRHLSFGPDPSRQMWVVGQLFNLNTYNAVPSGIKVTVQYGTDKSYGAQVVAEIRQLVTHVPVWNGAATGPVTASTTDLLNADQYYVHALLNELKPGGLYHYRFVYSAGGQTGLTPDATFYTAPDQSTREPFTSDPDYYDPTSTTAPTGISPVAAPQLRLQQCRHPQRCCQRSQLRDPRHTRLRDGTQAAWVKSRLAEFRARPDIDFIVVFFHHCAFSTCSSWSQARYRDYAFVALDVDPAPPGYASTMPLSAINEQGVEFDRVVFSRTARAT